MTELKECPRCGSEEYYMKQSVKGTAYYIFHFDGTEADNSDLYNNLEMTNRWKHPRCAKCGKILNK